MELSRKRFLGLTAGAVGALGRLGAALPARGKAIAPLKVTTVKIAAGAAAPFRAVQVSDTHLVRVDKRDDARKQQLAAGRCYFTLAEHYLDEAMRLARPEDLLLHTGDMIDFVSEANLDLAGAHFASRDWFVCAGNHEFSRFVGEAKEDAAYKAGSFEKVQAAYPNDLAFASRVVKGVNFVALDNVYYNVTEAQHTAFEKEIAKGLPIVLLCHVPFYGPALYDYVMKATKNKCAYLIGAPRACTDAYLGEKDSPDAWRWRGAQQRTDRPTADFIAWLKAQKLLKGILAGHLHHSFAERFSPTAMQYVCGGNYRGEAQVIEFA